MRKVDYHCKTNMPVGSKIQRHIHGNLFVQSLPEELQQLANLIDLGKMKPIVAKKFPLKAAAAAHKEFEKECTRGKMVLTVV